MKRSLNFLLIITFILTLLVPLTGVHIHKLASLLFLLLCLVHAGLHWEKMDARRGVVLGLIIASFLAGVFGLIFDETPIILALHRVLSIAVVLFLAIHIFVFTGKICPRSRKKSNDQGDIPLDNSILCFGLWRFPRESRVPLNKSGSANIGYPY